MDINDTGNLVGLAADQAIETKLQNALQRSESNGTGATKDVAREFTAILYLEVLKAMRAASPEEGFLETDRTCRDIYNGMMDSELAKVMAKQDKTGLTNMVESSVRKTAKAKPKTQTKAAGLGVISSPYGLRRDPFTKSATFHEGIDIAAPAGAPIKVPMAGQVSFSGTVPGYGKMVEVNHGNGLKTRYAHNSANLVSVGIESRWGIPLR